MPRTPPFLPRRLNEGRRRQADLRESRHTPPAIPGDFLSERNSEAWSAGGCGPHFWRVHIKTEMREVGLSQGHEAGVEVTPNEKKQERHGRIVFVQNGVQHGEEKIDPQYYFCVGHPASLVSILFRSEGVLLTFDLVFWRAGELAFLSDNGFNHGLSVANGNSDANGHHERHV